MPVWRGGKKMKKILMALLACLLIAGCSSKEAKEEHASCVIEQAGLMTMDVDFSAKNDEITEMVMKITIDSSLFGGVDFSTMDDEAKGQVKDAMLKQLGISEDTKGLTTEVDFTDTMVVTVGIDLNTASKEDLKKIGLDIENTDMSFKRLLEDSEKEGYTCTKK